jgi:hypothetical protein
MSSIARFREEAEKCRRIAAASQSASARDRWLKQAEKYDDLADQLERAEARKREKPD